MTATLPLLLFGLGVAAVAALVVVGYIADSKRRERLFAAATLRGWTYTREDPTLLGRWQGTPFGQGDSRKAADVLTGTWAGQPFVAFTYSYETSSTDSKGNRTSTTHRFAVTVRTLPAWLPRLEVTPESFAHRMARSVGLGSDIELESEEFNRAFLVRADDPKYASDLLPARTMERMLAGPREAWRIDGTSVLTWNDGALDVDQVERRLAMLDALISTIPAYIWKDHGYDPSNEPPGG